MSDHPKLNHSVKNSARVTGLVCLTALLVLNIVLLSDADRRVRASDGRGFYGFGLPNGVIDGAVSGLLALWIAYIVFGWVRENRRLRRDRAGRSDAP